MLCHDVVTGQTFEVDEIKFKRAVDRLSKTIVDTPQITRETLIDILKLNRRRVSEKKPKTKL